MTDAKPVPRASLQTRISVSSQDGRLHAVVELHGELTPLTATDLRRELDQLVADGIADIAIDLGHVRLCTSRALDVFDQIHHALLERHGGGLRLDLAGAARTVRRVVQVVDGNDPTFSPQITEAPATSEPMAPSERPGDSTAEPGRSRGPSTTDQTADP